jgi:hypothetical protein
VRVVRVMLLALLAALAIVASGNAQQDSAQVRRLTEQVEAITRELEALKLGRDVVAQADSTVTGLGPAASKVYRVRQGVSIGGYGEVLYENFGGEREDGAASGARDQIDALRAIVYVGYKFTDRLLFNSEIEFEHGNTEGAGSVAVEFAYLEYRASPAFGARAGMVLIPMGFLNEQHEPPVYLGARRPLTETFVIPSTWHENGLGAFGSVAGFTWRAYLVNGLDATGVGESGAEGFSASEGIREGRQGGAKAAIEDVAGVARVDWSGLPGVTVGVSGYLGNSGQSATLPSDPSIVIDARTTVFEGHLEYRGHGFEFRALGAVADVDEAAEVNEILGNTAGASIGSRLTGWYLQAGYDVLRGLRTEHQLIPYVRYEEVNTQAEVPGGFAKDPATDRTAFTFGAAWRPITQIAVKADYQWLTNQAESGVDQLNVSLGWLF